MYTLIAIFYVSIVAIAGMILNKRYEVKTGKPTLVSAIGRGSDHIFAAAFVQVRKLVSYMNRKTFVALAQWVAFHLLLRTRKVYVEVKHRFISTPHGKKLIDAVRGRGEVNHHGASFYLRRISQKE